MVSSLQGKIDEAEKKFAETSKMNQVPHSDNELMIKLVVENEQHKVMCPPETFTWPATLGDTTFLAFITKFHCFLGNGKFLGK